MNGGPREGFHVGFLAIAPAFSFNRAFIRLPPPPLCDVGGTREVLMVVCLIIVLAFSFKSFSSRFSWLHSLVVHRCGSGF